MQKFACTFVIIAFFFGVPAVWSAEKVHVTLYYESLCPDSIKFFNQQLYPSLQMNLSNYINLQLVPFGKSSQTRDGDDYKFTCHHGPGECLGNKIHSCALKKIDGGVPSENLSFNRKSVGFINCLMAKVTPDGDNTKFPTKECAELNNVANLVEIENCAIHKEGSQFLSNYGTLTSNLKPALKGVPTIVFNKQYKQEDDDLAKTNFAKALCSYIGGTKPEECNNSSAIKLSLSAIVLVVAMVLNNF